MDIASLGLYSPYQRNLKINNTEETEDESTITQLNTATSNTTASQTTSQSNASKVQKISDTSEDVEQAGGEQSASLTFSYGVGQNIPTHTYNQTTPQDFTFDFSMENDYQLVGATNKLEDVDVEKGISDMKKETVLDQYKYFVNPIKLGSDQDGSVRIVSWD